jgi:hypothetical protein
MSKLSDPAVAEMAEILRSKHGLDTLIETGTFEGESTLWAAQRFRRVYTIEICPDFHGIARDRCADHRNIIFLSGDTRFCLPFVLSAMTGPVMLWLDAHAAPGLFGEADDWPVMEELSVIERSPHHHVVLIDDAHCFMPDSPYPRCPPLAAVEKWALLSGYECAIKGDVIVLTPVE